MIMFRKIRGKHLYIVISFGIGIIFAIVGLLNNLGLIEPSVRHG